MDLEASRFGGPAKTETLRAERARGLADFLAARDDVGCRFVETREDAERSWVIVEVEVDVGQAPAADIRRREPIAVGFSAEDRAWPAVWSLRDDFPQPLPHEFLVPEGHPASLCLSEAPWPDARRRWSPGSFVRLLRTWLIDTARGALHRPDQVLEPFIVGSPIRIILPSDVLTVGVNPQSPLFGFAVGGSENAPIPIYRLAHRPPAGGSAKLVAALISAPSRPQSGLRHTPTTLGQLRDLLQADDFDFEAILDQVVGAWLGRRELLDAMGVLLIHIPVSRDASGEDERNDIWGFLIGATVGAVGESLGLWSTEGPGGPVLPALRSKDAKDWALAVQAMNPTFDPSPQSMAFMNGYAGPSGKVLVAVGAGALGSQIMANLLRAGEALSAVADEDDLLPHNFARHAIWNYDLVGTPKATAMQVLAQVGFPGSLVPMAINVDASDLDGDGAAALRQNMEAADVVLDFAASVPVSRHLALDAPGAARRVSAFLSPNGLDLVVLAEDLARTARLDHLELNYYRATADDARLDGHFALPSTSRYARGCREVSAQLPQARVATHAGIAASVIRDLLGDDRAMAAVWRLDPSTHEVRRVDLDLRPFLRFVAGDWEVLISPALVEQVAARRSDRLPAETGGVILGDFDTSRRSVYLTATLDPPADSTEQPTHFIRGAAGLDEAITRVRARTLDMLQYVGEWHSHPGTVPASPSAEDFGLYRHLQVQMSVEGYPPVMMIVAEDHFSVLVDGVLAVGVTAATV